MLSRNSLFMCAKTNSSILPLAYTTTTKFCRLQLIKEIHKCVPFGTYA